MQRALKSNPNVRCCWICGKIGGSGFTAALRISGYIIPKNEIGYAHSTCMQKTLKRSGLGQVKPSPK